LRRFLTICAALSALCMLSACDDDTSGAARDTRATMTATEQGSVVVGYPAIINWAEKKNLRMIYELRDNPKLVTWSYTTDLNGKLHNACDGSNSVGYPIPYSTQFTAPKAPVIRRAQYPSGAGAGSGEWRTYEADQPEPNGLYMPTSAEATWVLCFNPDTKAIEATYIEDRVRTYLHKVQTALDH
jgi:hypothetical protein